MPIKVYCLSPCATHLFLGRMNPHAERRQFHHLDHRMLLLPLKHESRARRTIMQRET